MKLLAVLTLRLLLGIFFHNKRKQYGAYISMCEMSGWWSHVAFGLSDMSCPASRQSVEESRLLTHGDPICAGLPIAMHDLLYPAPFSIRAARICRRSR